MTVYMAVLKILVFAKCPQKIFYYFVIFVANIKNKIFKNATDVLSNAQINFIL